MRPIDEGTGLPAGGTPASGTALPSDRARKTPAAAPPTARVIVVDDEPQIRDLVAQALRREGYRVSTFDDGHRALAEIQGGDVQILLTDLKMPRMSGLDLIRAAREVLPGIGSILITAFSSTETAVQALRFGADDYLTKPFQIEELRTTVSRVLTERRMARHEQDAVARVRHEATTLRERQREVEGALRDAESSLARSHGELARRVRDLEFVRELTHLLARKGDLARMLQTLATILNRRFRAHVTRIELALPGGVHVSEHREGKMPAGLLGAMGADLLRRARHEECGAIRDVVLGYGRPLEGFAANVDINGRGQGGITLLREPQADGEDCGDLPLLSLVPQALGTAVESELNRLATEESALSVAIGMLQVLEGRGALYAGHADRVARNAREIAEALGLSTRLCEVVETAARLHDVGGVGIPDGVLQREGPLTAPEIEVVRRHPVVGSQILAPFGEAAVFVRHHHERPDGTGYPDQLQGDQIPLGAGIIGVAEAFDAMTSARPYRRPRSRREALSEIGRYRGTQFVAQAVDGLMDVMQEAR